MRFRQEYKYGILVIAGISFAWFIVSVNLVPLFRNKDLNIAVLYANQGQCNQALELVGRVPQTGYLASYIQSQYLDVITLCLDHVPKETQEPLLGKAIELLQERGQQHSYYTRTWLGLGAYINLLLDRAKEPEQKQLLAVYAEDYLMKAKELSPNREEMFERLVRTSFFAGRHEQAIQRADQCLAFNPANKTCSWLKTLTTIYLGERTSVSLERGSSYDMFVAAESSLLQLLQAYLATDNIAEAIEVYERLAAWSPNPQYLASLAFAYRQNAQYDFAVLRALNLAERHPTTKQEAKEFLKTIPTEKLSYEYQKRLEEFLQQVP